MNFREFLLITEAAPAEYKVVNKPQPAPWLTYIPLGIREAEAAEKKFLAGRMKMIPFLKKQEIGFRAIIKGTEYLRSMDGIFAKKIYPISGHKGSGIGQRELYSPSSLRKYTTLLKKNPTAQTDPLTVAGTPDNYLVRDGHHRMQAYKNAKRSEVPVWIEVE